MASKRSVQYVSPDWYNSTEGRLMFQTLITPNQEKRKLYGLLEQPSYVPSKMPEEYSYKIVLSGKSGVGKSSTISRLLGSTVIKRGRAETPGISSSVLFWPAKLLTTGQVILFRLIFWDSGESTMKKFDHILPACKDKADAIIFLFAFNDKSSFLDIPHQISRVLNAEESTLKFVMGTKIDQQSCIEVSRQDITQFEQQWRLQVLAACNMPPPGLSGEAWEEMKQVAPLLNHICNELWHRDQVLTGNVSVDAGYR